MVGYKCVIHQRVNYVLDHLYFRGYSQSAKTNVLIMSKADNYNEYNYDQLLGKKYTGQKRYTIRGLSMRSGLSQRSDTRRLMKEDK